MVVGKLGRQGRPHVAGLTVAVEQDHRRTLATGPDVEGRALRLDRLSAEPGGKWLHCATLSSSGECLTILDDMSACTALLICREISRAHGAGSGCSSAAHPGHYNAPDD
jgi:hypothetical protein